MKQPQNPDCFARQCLGHHKELLARKLREVMRINGWSRKEAADVFGISTFLIGYLVRGEEWRISFDSLFIASTYAGITVNVSLTIPE